MGLCVCVCGGCTGRLLHKKRWALEAGSSLEFGCFTSFMTLSELLYVSEISVFSF